MALAFGYSCCVCVCVCVCTRASGEQWTSYRVVCCSIRAVVTLSRPVVHVSERAWLSTAWRTRGSIPVAACPFTALLYMSQDAEAEAVEQALKTALKFGHWRKLLKVSLCIGLLCLRASHVIVDAMPVLASVCASGPRLLVASGASNLKGAAGGAGAQSQVEAGQG